MKPGQEAATRWRAKSYGSKAVNARISLVALAATASGPANAYWIDREGIVAQDRANEASKRLRTIPGIGIIGATAIAAIVTDPKAFRNHVWSYDFVEDRTHDGRRCRREGRLHHTGQPLGNGYIESFDSRLRDELLNGEILYTLKEAKIVIES